MTFDEYSDKYLQALSDEARRLVQMGWNGHKQFWEQAAQAPTTENPEDALDCALSGQSYTERLIQSVCDELNAMAFDLTASHTVNGQWPATERDTAFKVDHLRRMASELHKLQIVPLPGVNFGTIGHVTQAAQSPASGEVEPIDEKGSLPWFCRVYNSGYHAGHHDTVEGGYTHIYPQDMDDYHEGAVIEILEDLQQESYTHQPAKVPEGLDLFDSIIGPAILKCAAGESELAVRRAWDEVRRALLTTPTPATTPATQPIKREDRLPTEADADPRGDVWVWDVACNEWVLANWEAVEHIPDYSHWMPTDLKRPTPPPQE